MGPYSTYSTYSMELGGSGAGHIAARRPTVRLWARHVRQGCSARAGGLQRSVFGRVSAWSVPQKAGPRVANYWPLYKALKLSAMEIALSDPNFRFSRTESLTHCAVTSTRMQRFSTARVSASKTLSSGRARHSNPSSMRSGGRIFAMSSKLWWSFARSHRDDPERLPRHLHSLCYL